MQVTINIYQDEENDGLNSELTVRKRVLTVEDLLFMYLDAANMAGFSYIDDLTAFAKDTTYSTGL